MKESYKEDLAYHFGLELYADGGNEAIRWGQTLLSVYSQFVAW
jgi:hypothetical protein